MSSQADTIRAQLQISLGEGARPDRVDEETRLLLDEVRSLAESAELVSPGPAPLGARGDPITIGAILLVMLPVAIPALIQLLERWIGRGNDRVIELELQKRGRSVKIKVAEGTTPAQVKEMIDALEDAL